MKIGIILIVWFVTVTNLASAQQSDSTDRSFREWYLRINPLSFFTRFGGVQLGVETILDKQAKLYLSTDVGYHFLNNTSSFLIEEHENKNSNSMVGFSVKPELKLVVSSNKKRPMGFVGLEASWLMAGVKNKGWFGMGELDATGRYPYFKYQDFKERATDIGGAIKYHHKLYFHKVKNHHLELFIGLGILNRSMKFINATGTLVQPENDVLVSDRFVGIRPQLPAGMRVLIQLK